VREPVAAVNAAIASNTAATTRYTSGLAGSSTPSTTATKITRTPSEMCYALGNPLHNEDSAVVARNLTERPRDGARRSEMSDAPYNKNR
jgi:hypothetical protein